MASSGELTSDRADVIERAGPAEVRVRRALLSVTSKQGIVAFARGLQELGVEVVSTGGIARTATPASASSRAVPPASRCARSRTSPAFQR